MDERSQAQEDLVALILEEKQCTVEAVTGFGKTRVAILLLQYLQKNNPNFTFAVVVPRVDLKIQWANQLRNLGLNGKVFVINTAVTLRQIQVDCVILDEIHNYASPEWSRIFDLIRSEYLLGLTATLERNDQRHQIIERYAPVIATITKEEGREKKYISDYEEIDFALDLDPLSLRKYEKVSKDIGYYFAPFNHKLQTAIAVIKNPVYGHSIAKRLNWTISKVHLHAVQLQRAINQRKQLLYQHPLKIAACKEIIEEIEGKFIIFSESIKFADTLAAQLPDAKAYHSKMSKGLRETTLRDFKQGKFSVLVTSKALDEGFDLGAINVAIIASATSSKRQQIQRMGRALRYVPGKRALIFNLYFRNTQDETWLIKRKGSSKLNVVDSLAEVV